ncbi:AraC family transcriptional regulator [Agrobacterium sp. InxBP2]|uniref:helix-turn-helix domain-containing protein n=1 Tax=Agrobacterium sp. InxBP2 TaxID=2870329 RepID=UPI00249E89B9|nr:AraC family transcriptional regulator [Agrobacterium sp. InxBP2]MCW8279630.1 AraC family transcriptional regulator [Agrobacterium sp. InxBP2]
MKRNSLKANGMDVVHVVGNQDASDNETKPVTNFDGFSVVVQRTNYVRHSVWRSGRLVFHGGHASGSMAIMDVEENWSCRPESAFDNVRFNISSAGLRDFALEQGRVPFALLRIEDGPVDPVLKGLAETVVPLVSNNSPHRKLLIDHLAEAVKAHVACRYGGIPLTERKGGLSAKHLDLATQYFVSCVDKEVVIDEIASLCGLSVGYFIRAFKRSTGLTPYQWLLDYRVRKAQDMLRQGIPLAQIALECSFADQGHFSRIFKAKFGVSPAAWRDRIR